MISATAAGIDIGAGNSAAAVWTTDGRTRMVPDPLGRCFTPTVVRLAEGEILVGEEAARSALLFPDETAPWIKRELGASWYSRSIRGRRLPPEVILACVLRKLREDAERETGGAVPAAAAVPWYFDDARRKAAADAMEIAGWQCLGLVNEPTAAVLALAESLGRLDPRGDFPPSRLLVYDLGAAAFKAAVMRLKPGGCRTIAADAEIQLGGYDWDVRLVEWLADKLAPQGLPDPRYDASVWSRVYPAAVEAKHALSSRRRTTVLIELAGRSFQTVLDREEFEDISADLLHRTRTLTERLLDRTGIGWEDLDGVLAVGGAVRMPAVAEMLERLSGKPLLRPFPPDEAVARGAAVFAEWLRRGLLTGDEAAGWRIRETASQGLWVETRDPRDGTPRPVPIVPPETVLPVEVEKVFCTERDGQRSIAFRIWEGSGTPGGEIVPLGEVVIGGLPPDLPKGRPIRVTFQCPTDGRWRIHAEVPDTDCRAEVELRRETGLNPRSVRQWRDFLESPASLGTDRRLDRALSPPDVPEAGTPEPSLTEQPASRDRSEGESPTAAIAEPPPGREHPRLAAAEKLGRRARLQLQTPPLTPSAEDHDEVREQAGPPTVQPVLLPVRPVVTREMLLNASAAVPHPVAGREDSADPRPGVESAPAADRFFLAAAEHADLSAPGPVVAAERQSARNRFRDRHVALPWGGSVPRWVIGATGFVVSGVLGLLLGYVLIRYLVPDSPLLRIWP
ncbi:MAG: Hsp70 family protein [Thermogutta sp.]|nr:Hsp70 family protein [Thermogutta sp.]